MREPHYPRRFMRLLSQTHSSFHGVGGSLSAPFLPLLPLPPPFSIVSARSSSRGLLSAFVLQPSSRFAIPSSLRPNSRRTMHSRSRSYLLSLYLSLERASLAFACSFCHTHLSPPSPFFLLLLDPPGPFSGPSRAAWTTPELSGPS